MRVPKVENGAERFSGRDFPPVAGLEDFDVNRVQRQEAVDVGFFLLAVSANTPNGLDIRSSVELLGRCQQGR